MRKHLALLRAQSIHEARDPLGAEEPHEIIFQRQEELRRTRITLTAGASTQLPVDAPRFMALGADDVQAADLHDVDLVSVRILHLGRFRIGHAGSEFDVGAAAGHVRRNRHRGGLTRARDDLCLTLVILRVQHVVLKSGATEQFR